MDNLKSIEEAISFKIRSAHYHKVMSERSGINTITNYDEHTVSAMEFTAMMTTLHSTLDLIAQWINKKYNLELDVTRLNIKKIFNKIRDVNLKRIVNQLREDTIYLDDFCNQIKHRNIIKVNHQWYFVSPFQPAVEENIEAFSRSGRYHNSQNLFIERRKNFEIIHQAIRDVVGIHIVLANND